MPRKYARLDARLLVWLSENRSEITTAKISGALKIKDTTVERHLSRKLSYLEDIGVITCEHRGTRRVCQVIKDPPKTMAKQPWRPRRVEPAKIIDLAKSKIKAVDSIAFEAAGGVIERLPTTWDQPTRQRQIGAMTFQDRITNLD